MRILALLLGGSATLLALVFILRVRFQPLLPLAPGVAAQRAARAKLRH